MKPVDWWFFMTTKERTEFALRHDINMYHTQRQLKENPESIHFRVIAAMVQHSNGKLKFEDFLNEEN